MENKLDVMMATINKLATTVNQIDTRLNQMDIKINQLTEGQTQLITGQAGILVRIDNVEGQLNENTQMIKSLVHWTEELDAKYENLLHTTPTRDSIVNLDSKFDVLNNRLFQQEAKILSLVK